MQDHSDRTQRDEEIARRDPIKESRSEIHLAGAEGSREVDQ
jgi:hypothetical protein